MTTSIGTFNDLETRLMEIERERVMLDEAEEIFVKGGLKEEYLELRREAKTHLQEAKIAIEKIEKLAPVIMRQKGYKMFFKSYERVVLEYAKDGWTARNMLFLAGEEDRMIK